MIPPAKRTGSVDGRDWQYVVFSAHGTAQLGRILTNHQSSPNTAAGGWALMSAIKHSTKQNSSCHIVSAVGRKLPDHSFAEIPPLTSQQTEALDLFDALAED